MVEQAQDTEQQQDMSELAGKYLTFKLADEEFGLQILKVQEIIEMLEITKVPRMPPYVKGVINLRGKVIPVLDLRSRFEMEEKEVDRNTCIIVVYVRKGDTDITMGLIVDEVCEVMEVTPDQIEPAPTFGTQVDTSFILGMAKTEESVKMLLDIDMVLTEKEMAAVQQAGK